MIMTMSRVLSALKCTGGNTRQCRQTIPQLSLSAKSNSSEGTTSCNCAAD